MDEPTTDDTTEKPASPPPPPARKKAGRPRKNSIVIEPTATEPSTDSENLAAAELALTTSPNLSDCRRSSRKKNIKFDVRDLLNKNRRPHKIQIEARIDSNALIGVEAAVVAPISSSNRPFAGLDSYKDTTAETASNTAAVRPALEIFAKPKSTQSLTVALANSEEPMRSEQMKAAKELPTAAPRKRGRPRKLQLATEQLKQAARSYSFSDSDTNSTNSSNSNSSTTTTSMSSSSGSNSSTGSGTSSSTSSSTCSSTRSTASPGTSLSTSDSSSEIKKKTKSKLRVSLKRMNMPISCEYCDSGESIPTPPINLVEVSNSSLATVEEVDEGQSEMETDNISLLPADDEDSNSQIIFVEIETVKLALAEQESANFKLIFPKEEQKQLKADRERELSMTVVRETPSVWSADDDEDAEQPQQHSSEESTDKLDLASLQSIEESRDELDLGALAATVVSPISSEKRRSKRGSLRGNASNSNSSSSSSKMTLEETFAEIAAESSKSILKREPDKPLELKMELALDSPLNFEGSNSNNTFKIISKLESKKEEQLESVIQLKGSSAVQLETNHSTLSEIKEERASVDTLALMPSAEEPQISLSSSSNSSSNSSTISQTENAIHAPIVECDELFKALDKANVDLHKKAKPNNKKLRAKKKPNLEPEPEMENIRSSKIRTPTASACLPIPRIKKQLIKNNPRRNTISEDRANESATPSCYKRRNSLHPRKTSHSPELPQTQQIQSEPTNQKGRKAAPDKQLSLRLSRQDSMDSSSSVSQYGFKRKTRKFSDALQFGLIATEYSESTSSSSKLTSSSIPTPTAELETQNPLKDIAKFIEDGVKLLERDLKPEDEQEHQHLTDDELALRLANMETPTTTPSSSPQHSSVASCSDSLTGAVRRSHRIKQKPQARKASVGRGVANIGINSRRPSSSISMEDQLAELAHIDSINERFLRQEGLNVFQPLRDNYYRCARQVSQENAEMQCDCFLTGDEEAMGHLCCGAGCINRMLMIECGPLCTNGERCTNKRFQQHQCWPCRVFRTEKKGCGITAELQIPPGEFIMEYVGEVIDSEEFERRQHLYSQDRNRHYYFMALRGEAIIDATSKGNISRYINHSCDPNAETQKWTVNGELRIGFFSVKTIMPGEEITFDYMYQRYGRDAQRCYCEARNCRGWIGGEPDSDEGEQLEAESDSEVDYLAEELDELEAHLADKMRQKNKAIKGSKSKVIGKQLKLPAASRKQRKEQPKAKDREYKPGRWLRPSGSGEKSFSARKPDKLEDPDVLEQLTLLNRSGLKNQADTLRFSRCMVRAKLLETRLQLLSVLTRGELPCRRLFLDYHGLRLLHAWFSESNSDNQLRVALLDVLESLPIPNRTMLNDSRVYQSVQLWSIKPEKPEQLEHKSADTEMGKEKQNGKETDPEAARQRILVLLQKWNSLPEIFRIPKRERIEQMKEHEREADRQQKSHHINTALEDSNSNSASSTLSSDRYRQDRFRRDTTSRYDKSKLPIRLSGNNAICTITSQSKERHGSTDGFGGFGGFGGLGGINSWGAISKADPRKRSELPNYDPRRTISKELRRSLFERKVAQDEAEKRNSSEDWREHEMRSDYFGADLKTDPKLLPFYQNTETNEWFNKADRPVPTPLRCSHATSEPKSPECNDGMEYRLPAGVAPLPASWHWNVTAEGHIYYYNLKDRISQWEPPNTEQRMEQLIESSPDEEPEIDAVQLAAEMVEIDAGYVGTLSEKSLAQYIEAKVRERRKIRRNRLVSVCVISPRREEDRAYNQLESRKYKENKEKIRRRKEIFRRKRMEANNGGHVATGQVKPSDTLPIHAYLYSSDEEVDSDATASAASCVKLPLLDVIVDGVKDTRVDELEVVIRGRNKSKSLPLSLEPSTSKSALAALTKQNSESDLLNMKRKLPMPLHISPDNQKKHRGERDKKRKPLISATAKGREACEKFRFEISGHVADFLRPYRKDSCQLGRITSDEDYKFLIKRLTHHITTKEMRYCDMSGNLLACTESVKHKSYDFINQYMKKKGSVYKKPADELDY